ncbi:MAG TPA: metal ABC transporter substrate-binding protein, partial [Phycisphaerales bacterium]|nr:metal ABC transporter substrate-binding protein [Phycisphaerales bacterium]
TFTVLADIARNVAGDAAVVESITKPGAEIHDYEPTPGDIVKAQSADLVLVNGLGLERWFERFMGKVKDVPTALLSEGVEPIGITTGPYDGKPNPHAWMSPANAVKYVANIRDALVKLDPANGAVYKANAERYSAQLMEVDRTLRASLESIPREQRVLVSCEGAFSYLCRDYGLRELYLWPVNADEEGTPQQVQAVINGVRAAKVPVCFSESTISDKAMRQVCKETGARYGGVLYVDSLTDADGPAPSYLALLRFNAETIISGFGAGPPAR